MHSVLELVKREAHIFWIVSRRLGGEAKKSPCVMTGGELLKESYGLEPNRAGVVSPKSLCPLPAPLTPPTPATTRGSMHLGWLRR